VVARAGIAVDTGRPDLDDLVVAALHPWLTVTGAGAASTLHVLLLAIATEDRVATWFRQIDDQIARGDLAPALAIRELRGQAVHRRDGEVLAATELWRATRAGLRPAGGLARRCGGRRRSKARPPPRSPNRVG
jgi:hypothetical protein